jgi:hypothetical protein
LCNGGNGVYQYVYTDRQVSQGSNFYRIRAVDQNGTSSYSEIEVVFFNAGSMISVFPNPVKNNLRFSVTHPGETKQATYKVYNALMQQQLSGYLKLQRTNSQHLIPLNGFQRGIYILRVVSGNEVMQEKFVVH